MPGSHRIEYPESEMAEYIHIEKVKGYMELTLMVPVMLERVQTRLINLNAYNGRSRFSGNLLPNNYQGNSPLPRFFISTCLEACTCELKGARDKVKEEI